MAHYQNQYDNTPVRRDEYGNPIDQTDAYGNPVHLTRTEELGHHRQTAGYENPVYGSGAGDAANVTTGGYGAAPGSAAGTGYGVMGHQGKEHQTLGGMLHRSGSSSSSSSSEDDGQGGRRKKKGLKEKVKEGLPGVHKVDTTGHTATTTTPGGYTVTGEERHHEKRGLMDKIKDKLPGHHNH